MEGKFVKAVDLVVVPSEKAPDMLGVASFETALAHFAIAFQQGLGHHEGCLSVGSRAVEVLFAEAVVFEDGFGEMEGRVDEDAVETVEHLCVHGAH